jgi:hypothetical protein
MEQQITDHVLMIRPAAFGYNPETAVNNTFQHDDVLEQVALKAQDEFDRMVESLRNAGVTVTVFEDTSDPVKPDAVFPNNWLSMHADGRIVTYPMYAPLRRVERSEALLDMLTQQYAITQWARFEAHEANHVFLEGTGSLVLDRVNRIAYACLSPRTDPGVLQEWCDLMQYTPFEFHAFFAGQPVYHTNVLMAIGEGIVVVGLDVIEKSEQTGLLASLESGGREVVLLTAEQIGSFAGNMLAVHNANGEQLMIMSSTAYGSLHEEQIRAIEKYARIVAVDVRTIEHVGGGSVRCMLAENFLPPI